MVRAKVTCKLLFSPLEWLGPVVIDSGKQDKWRIFLPFFVWKHSCLAFSNGRLWNHSLQSFPSYLQTWRQPDPLSPCNFRTHFINWLCQQVLLIPRNGVCGGFWCLFGGSWPLVHCGNWMVDSGWWLCFSWGYLVSWLNIFEWPLECSAEAGGLAKDSFASHKCGENSSHNRTYCLLQRAVILFLMLKLGISTNLKLHNILGYRADL